MESSEGNKGNLVSICFFFADSGNLWANHLARRYMDWVNCLFHKNEPKSDNPEAGMKTRCRGYFFALHSISNLTFFLTMLFHFFRL